MTESNKNLNVKFPEKDYKELQRIAKDVGLSLSSLIRMMVYSRLKRVQASGNSTDFFDLEI